MEVMWERQAVNGNQWQRRVLMPILLNSAAFNFKGKHGGPVISVHDSEASGLG